MGCRSGCGERKRLCYIEDSVIARPKSAGRTARLRGNAKTPLGYAAMLAAAALIFVGIRWLGLRLAAPAGVAAGAGGGASGPAAGTLTHVLLALVVVLVAARSLGALFRRWQQPAVVGEMIAGILLGPSLLGRAAPGLSHFLLPGTVAPYISVIAQIGVILYMFLVGLELDTGLLKQRTHAAVAISHASIVGPFLLGAGLALWLYPRYSSSNVSFTLFALLLGVAMSITAFPVLARILTDQHLHTSRMGAVALACAAVDDVTAWCLFAFVVGLAHARPAGALVTLAWTAGFIVTVLVAGRPAAAWYARRYARRGASGQGAIVVVCAALLLGALATERIGIHALFGAFLIGVVIPHDSALARDVMRKFEDLVVVLLLPMFFAFTGMRTQIALVQGWQDWAVCAAIVLVASLGKFGCGALAARWQGLGWRQAASLGILMNARGLMELIVLNLGLDLGILSPTLFAMLVIMAIVTTFVTTPALQVATGRRQAFVMEQAS